MSSVLEVQIDGLGHSGDGVGRLPDGQVVFVPHSLPGDRVQVRLGEIRKKVQYADLIEIVEPSRDRVVAACKADACGGCPLKKLDPAVQAQVKRQRVIDTMRRIGGIDVAPWLGPTITFGDSWRYRHRARFQLCRDGTRWDMGYFQQRSHEIVSLNACPVLWPELETIALALKAWIAAWPKEAGLQFVAVSYSRRDRCAVAWIRANDAPACVSRVIDGGWPKALVGIVVDDDTHHREFGRCTLRYDHKNAEYYDLFFGPMTFTQINPEANDRLVEDVVEAVEGRAGLSVLELHAGIGNFTLALARVGASITSIESNQRSVNLARRSLQRAGQDAQTMVGNDTQVSTLSDSFDVLLLDPPRTGAKDAVQWAAKSGPPRVVYVSCDAATFARDTAILAGAGYQLQGLHVYDVFPHTPHVETLGVLEKA